MKLFHPAEFGAWASGFPAVACLHAMLVIPGLPDHTRAILSAAFGALTMTCIVCVYLTVKSFRNPG